MKYDRPVKRKFNEMLKTGLYQSHGAYLSNPLICTIMLITFDQGAGIPEKMSVFFSQAFDTLFYRHDATKSFNVRRKSLTKINIEEFRLSLVAFNAFSYLDFQSSFLKRDQALECARKAAE